MSRDEFAETATELSLEEMKEREFPVLVLDTIGKHQAIRNVGMAQASGVRIKVSPPNHQIISFDMHDFQCNETRKVSATKDALKALGMTLYYHAPMDTKQLVTFVYVQEGTLKHRFFEFADAGE